MAKIKAVIPFLILIALLSMLTRELYSANYRTPTASIVGENMPIFSLPNLIGNQRMTSSTLPKGRVILINVWASWCSACRAEHSMMMKIKDQYHIPIYGILYRDDAKTALQYLSDKGNPYVAIGDDADGDVAVDFGVYGTPETFVINPEGKIIYRQVGVISDYTWKNTIYPLIKQYR